MERDGRIDILRTLGIMLIILAHVGPPTSVAVPRMFDVPLMTFLMGMGIWFSTGKKERYFTYVAKRFKRLLIPAFVFLIIFFILFNIINIFSETTFSFSLKNYLGSFSTFSGIGYIWIIRVFFIMSILSPIFLVINKKIKKLKYKLIFLTILLFLQEVLTSRLSEKTGFFYFLVNNIFVMTLGYAIVTLVGMWIYKQSSKENIAMIMYFLILFIILLVKYNFWNMANYKYPPFPIYLIYGILISIILWEFFSIYKIRQKMNEIKIITWISQNSMQLYYWHIIPIFYIENYTNFFIVKNWIGIYLITLCVAFAGTYAQINILKYFKKIKNF